MTPRRFPIGAEALPGGGAHFRVWAPRRSRVMVVGETGGTPFEAELEREDEGYFSGFVAPAMAGSTYRFRLDGDSALYPDPASRFQPAGPHGASMVVDPGQFAWSDDSWQGVERKGAVIYEMHVGTFTPEGTWGAAAERLKHLVETGITVVEVMPVSDFGGEFGWGYDGVNMFAPTRLYGTPDEFRAFVDRAHALGLGVILDVVYNHFGPDGNYQHAFAPDFFSKKHQTDWGEAINFDGENSGPVREFVTTNAAYWIREFHLDGLRVDATQNIYDTSPRHIVEELTTAAREAAGERSILVIAENEEQRVEHVVPREEGGFGMDGLWNDDLHHSAMVALTGHSEAYYSDYRGTPQEFISAVKWGYLFQGQWYKWQQRKRGTASLKTDPACFVAFLENHDQVANSGKGQRVIEIAAPAKHRALMAMVLLSPSTPMLFQGQEFGARTPFFYFAAHQPELSKLVDAGRKKFLAQFPSLASPAMQSQMVDPSAQSTFERSKLDWSERDPGVTSLVRDLLRIRREDRVIASQAADVDGAVLSHDAFLIRFFCGRWTGSPADGQSGA